MKERPIIFSGPMVRAILDGTKTQTRRIVRPLGPYDGIVRCHYSRSGWAASAADGGCMCSRPVAAPPGEIGDRLWVRETHHQCPHCCGVTYRAGGWWRLPSEALGDTGDINDVDDRPLSPKCAAHGWRPSIYMPRWASRITLEVTDVRVERLQEASADDVAAEGIAVPPVDYSVDASPTELDFEREQHARELFRALWDQINGKRAPWSVNPWVWVVAFRRVT